MRYIQLFTDRADAELSNQDPPVVYFPSPTAEWGEVEGVHFLEDGPIVFHIHVREE